MPEPVTILIVVSLVGTCLTFVLNLFQSIKMNHFKSSCLGCDLEMDSDSEQEPEKKTE